MGIIDDLMKTMKEAVEEARRQQQAARGEATPPELTPLDRKLREHAQALEQQRAQQQAQQQARPAKPVPAGAPARQARRKTEPPPPPRISREHLRRLLHDPRNLRELMVLKEILDRPLALRRRNPGGFGGPKAP